MWMFISWLQIVILIAHVKVNGEQGESIIGEAHD